MENPKAQSQQVRKGSGSIAVGLGEVLWDVFPDGPRFGGAPANFACTLSGLQVPSLQVGLVSAVGQDDLGKQAVATLELKQVHTEWLAITNRPTGTVDVSLDEQGKASYSFAEDTAWDAIPWTDSLAALAARVDAVCFGTLGQRSPVSQTTILRFLDSVSDRCLRVFDVNLRSPFWNNEVLLASIQRCDVLKLNEDELPILQECCQVSKDRDTAMRELIQRYSLQLIALTEGSAGAILVSDTGESSHHPGVATTVVDTVGAGDAFTATLVAGLLSSMPLDEVNAWAAEVAAFVCTQSGATPELPERLRAR